MNDGFFTTSILFVLILIILWLATLYFNTKSKSKNALKIDYAVKHFGDIKATDKSLYQFYKIKSTSPMTKREYLFYKSLYENFPNHFILSQVQISAFVSAAFTQNAVAFKKIAMKSVDYVMVDKDTNSTALIIELQDSTHKEKNRAENDIFKLRLFEHLKIPFVQVEQPSIDAVRFFINKL
jgi:hypothetical protein